MTNEQALRELFQKWATSLPVCIGYDGSCDGDLVGMEHEPHCPMFGKAVASSRDAFEAGFRAGVEKERERANTCVVCTAVLLPDETIPHCETCIPTEEHEAQWLEAIRSGQDGGKG